MSKLIQLGECLHIKSSNHCLHWYRRKYGEKPSFDYGAAIFDDTIEFPSEQDKLHLQEAKKKRDEEKQKQQQQQKENKKDEKKDEKQDKAPVSCGNIWNHMTKEERSLINSKVLPPQHAPGHQEQSVRIDTKYLSSKQLLQEFVHSHFWVAYSRDSDHKTIETFYDRRKYLEDLQKSDLFILLQRQIEEAKDDKTKVELQIKRRDLIHPIELMHARNHFLDNIKKILQDCGQKNLTLCIKLGGYNFIDHYYSPTADNDNTMVVSVLY